MEDPPTRPAERRPVTVQAAPSLAISSKASQDFEFVPRRCEWGCTVTGQLRSSCPLKVRKEDSHFHALTGCLSSQHFWRFVCYRLPRVEALIQRASELLKGEAHDQACA